MMARKKEGRSAGDRLVVKLAVDHDFLVNDLGSGVAQVMAPTPTSSRARNQWVLGNCDSQPLSGPATE